MESNPKVPSQEVKPRPAATLVIARDGFHGLEVLLTLRPKHLRFMGGASVFPGGAVAAADLDPRWERCSTLPRSEAARRLGEEDEAAALGAFICAIRESVEEVGFPASIEGAATGSIRTPDPEAFLEACLEAGLAVSADRLAPAGRWVTPLGSPVRFDARFFVVPAPPGWEPSPDPSEVAGCEWMTPAAALSALASGSLLMAPPTIEMLQRLDGYRTTEQAIEGLSGSGVGEADVISVRLSPLVHVVLAPNPGLMTGPGTNTYVVGAPDKGGTLVIDPAVDDESYLEAVMRAAGSIASIVVTHRHSDHFGGVAALAEVTGAPVRAWGDARIGGREVTPLREGQILEAAGAVLEVMHLPGHASDHIGLFMRDAASLFAGDNILGEGTAVIAPPDGDMTAFMASLERLSRLSIDRIYPGHFRPLEGGGEVIRHLIAHRRAREEAIVEAVRAGARTVEEIVTEVYRDTPVELHPVARFSVSAHLQMAEAAGRVQQVDDGWTFKRHG
jgi:glyoxylase-like metal-dependent hydrolase (beta-lactamase superfamily II)/8-oxo-dGTP pyrophosphatase MutT (NUDIX family)